MDGPGPLGDFLQARRALLRPEGVGLRDLGPRRRVAGLRREELAHPAGVSDSYYTRLVQGLSRSASAEVLEAIARALLLDDHEREHLNRLAEVARRPPRARRPRREEFADETRDAVDGRPGTGAWPVGGTVAGRSGRPAVYRRRNIVDAIRYVDHNGGVWRALPAVFLHDRTRSAMDSPAVTGSL